MLLHPIQAEKGVSSLNHIMSFLLSVMASVIAYYICKWLDGEL